MKPFFVTLSVIVTTLCCKVRFLFPGRNFQIRMAYDVVSIKYGPCLVPWNHHCHSFGNSRTYHVSYHCTSEVVEKSLADFNIITGLRVRSTKILDSVGPCFVWKNKRAYAGSCFSGVPLLWGYFTQFIIEAHGPAFVSQTFRIIISCLRSTCFHWRRDILINLQPTL